MKKALLIVDVQNDFLPGGALPATGGDKIIPYINKLVTGNFDIKVATKDWHPAVHGSFASTHHKKIGEHILLNGIEQILWPDHCVQGTRGAEFASGWDHHQIEKIFYKGTDPSIDSYSTFFDNKHLRSTGLGDYLKEKGITDVYVAGLATDYCVKYSVLDAHHLGFKTHVFVDACRGINVHPGDTEKAIEEMRTVGTEIIRGLPP